MWCAGVEEAKGGGDAINFRFSWARGMLELTLHLLFKVYDVLDAESAAAFGRTSAWHCAVLTGWRQWRAKVDHPPGAFMGRPRLLRIKEKNERVILVSYPRSGNSLLRGLLERVTGVVTGSDTRPDRVLSRSLLRRGLKGEGLVDERAWIIKTHWPERHGCAYFQAHRVILLIRNPFDAIDSYFNMGLTNTHEKSLREELYESLHDIWDEMVRAEIKVWAKFNAYWLKKALPVLAIRYEDLILHPEEILTRLVSFLEKMPCEKVSTSAYGDRIRAAARDAFKSQQTPYKPRSGAKIGTSLRHYTREQIMYMCEEEDRSLRAFGYDPLTQGFPKEILTLPPMERCVKNLDVVGAVVTVNKGRMVRGIDDKYGRNITKVRHALTDSDKVPLPTMSKEDKAATAAADTLPEERGGSNGLDSCSEVKDSVAMPVTTTTKAAAPVVVLEKEEVDGQPQECPMGEAP